MKEELIAIFGAVSEDVLPHSFDRTENPPHRPAYVVSATRAEQVGELLRLAGARRVPVTPKVAGENVGGLAIPAEGGIVLDLRALRACDIDPVHAVAWIEPGVTWEQLKAEASRHGLSLGFPLAPPDTSVLAGALMDGLGTRSLLHGSYGDWITGVEAYLADGTKVVTGSAALSGRPLSRGPLPDLTGLFVGWFGATGIVTRLGFCLWPERPFRRRDAVPCRTPEEAQELLLTGSRTGLFDDLGALSWPAGKWALGVDDPGPRDPGEPEIYVIADYGADTKGGLVRRRRVLAALAPREPVPADDLLRLCPELAPFADLPARLSFLLDHPGGGLSWVGTYGPMDRLAEGARAGAAILAEHGFPPLTVMRPMKGGHYAVLRLIERFDRRDPDATERVRKANVALARALVDLGYVPYKCPAALKDVVLPRLDPGFRDLLSRVKRALDPHGLLNPDRW